MTKNDLIEKIAKLMPSKKEATIIVNKMLKRKFFIKYENESNEQFENRINKMFDEMLTALVNGEKVVITGFGSFNLLVTQAKKGRNPKTGDAILIEPKKKIKFKQSKEIFNV